MAFAGVMLAHGHRKDARLDIASDDKLRQSIADGAERFESGGKSTCQAMCRQLARMGCVVWQWTCSVIPIRSRFPVNWLTVLPNSGQR